MSQYVIKRMHQGNWWYVQSPNDATTRLDSSVRIFSTHKEAFLFIAEIVCQYQTPIWDSYQVWVQEVEPGLQEKY